MSAKKPYLDMYLVRYVNLDTGRFFEKKLDEYRLNFLRVTQNRQILNYELIGVIKT